MSVDAHTFATKMQDATKIKDACATIEGAMRDALDEAARHAELRDEFEQKAAAEVVLMDQSKARAERLRLSVLDLDPNYQFGAGAPAEGTRTGGTDEKEVSEHKQRYGRWAKVAVKALKEIRRGTFQQVADHVKANDIALASLTDRELEGLRGALHGLAKRTKNKRVEYERGEGSEGGTFVYVNGTDKE